MRQYIDIVEGMETPADRFIREIERHSDRFTIQLEPQDTNEVFISYIEGSKKYRGESIVDLMCAKADELQVKLSLVVDVYAVDDGGKLVPYYESKGFVIVGHTGSGEAFNDDGHFDLSLVSGNEFDYDQMQMERLPRLAEALNPVHAKAYVPDIGDRIRDRGNWAWGIVRGWFKEIPIGDDKPDSIVPDEHGNTIWLVYCTREEADRVEVGIGSLPLNAITEVMRLGHNAKPSKEEAKLLKMARAMKAKYYERLRRRSARKKI